MQLRLLPYVVLSRVGIHFVTALGELSRFTVGNKKLKGSFHSFIILCVGGVEYLHRSPASRRRRRKGNPVPGGITGPPCSWRI
jgi:hypothetical protein